MMMMMMMMKRRRRMMTWLEKARKACVRGCDTI
jgi:hypothetical protein